MTKILTPERIEGLLIAVFEPAATSAAAIERLNREILAGLHPGIGPEYVNPPEIGAMFREGETFEEFEAALGGPPKA